MFERSRMKRIDGKRSKERGTRTSTCKVGGRREEKNCNLVSVRAENSVSGGN